MVKNSQITDSFLCSYYLCNGSRASPGKSGGLALLMALLWGINLLWGASLKNLLLVDLLLSHPNHRAPVSQDLPGVRTGPAYNKALKMKGPCKDFESPGL